MMAGMKNWSTNGHSLTVTMPLPSRPYSSICDREWAKEVKKLVVVSEG